MPTGNEAVRWGSSGPVHKDCWTSSGPRIEARAGAAIVSQHNSASGSFEAGAREAQGRILDPYQSVSNAVTKIPR